MFARISRRRGAASSLASRFGTVRQFDSAGSPPGRARPRPPRPHCVREPGGSAATDGEWAAVARGVGGAEAAAPGTIGLRAGPLGTRRDRAAAGGHRAAARRRPAAAGAGHRLVRSAARGRGGRRRSAARAAGRAGDCPAGARLRPGSRLLVLAGRPPRPARRAMGRAARRLRVGARALGPARPPLALPAGAPAATVRIRLIRAPSGVPAQRLGMRSCGLRGEMKGGLSCPHERLTSSG